MLITGPIITKIKKIITIVSKLFRYMGLEKNLSTFKLIGNFNSSTIYCSSRSWIPFLFFLYDLIFITSYAVALQSSHKSGIFNKISPSLGAFSSGMLSWYAIPLFS